MELESKKSRLKPPWLFLAKVVLVPVCLFMIYRTVVDLGPARVYETASKASRLWLIVSVLPILLRFRLWSLRWWLMLARRIRVPVGWVHNLIMAGSFVNHVTPTAKMGGGLLRARLLQNRVGWRFTEAYGWVFADQWTGILGKVLLFGVAMFATSFYLSPEDRAFSPLVSGGVCILLVLAWVVLRQHLQVWFPHGLRFFKGRAESWSGNLTVPLLKIGSVRQILSVDIGLGSVSFFMLCLANALLFKALGTPVPLSTVVVVVLIGYMAGSVLGVMGGIGVTELFMIKLYAATGIAGDVAAAVTLLQRGMLYLYILCFGGFALWRVGRPLGEIERPALGTNSAGGD